MKKKILILSVSGMAGHMVYSFLNSLNKYDLFCTSRIKINNISSVLIDIEKDIDLLELKIDEIKPDIIINCIGVLIKESEIEPNRAIYINSLFPHILENITKDTNTKVIHLSTDCIFKGDIRESYSENNLPTETNWYGRTKALGELNNKKDLTLRMSIIGPQLNNKNMSLFHWVTTTKEEVLQCFDRVFWNGITTLELAKQIDRIVETNLIGIYHLVSDKHIIKGNLVRLINEIFNCKKICESNRQFYQNKILANNRRKEYDPKIPEYRVQLEELKDWIKNGYKI